MALSVQCTWRIGAGTTPVRVGSRLGSLAASTSRMQNRLTHPTIFARPHHRSSACPPTPVEPNIVITCSDKVNIEPKTNVEFPTSVVAPGGTSTLSLVGTGYREKNIAFIKVKVYAVGLYMDVSVITSLAAWKGKSKDDLYKDASFFKAIAAAPLEKAIEIMLIRDVDGATFWAALNEAVAPRLKAANAGAAGQEALDAFGEVFRGRSLKQGTSIYLTWVQPFQLQVAVSGNAMVPERVEASIVSADLVSSLFDVYLGESSVSPSTKASIASRVTASLSELPSPQI